MKQFISVLILLLSSGITHATESCVAPWPLWNEFSSAYIQSDGRIIDRGAGGISTSEGQSYALFFALIAGDKRRFDSILKWTSDNLSSGELGKNLPGWKWGKHSDGTWRILDKNSASDADLWIAYSLFHAAAIWNDRSYLATATGLLSGIAKQEIATLPGLGSMLLPAPYGFTLNENSWRLNPSYLPIQLLRYFSTVEPQGPWSDVATNTQRMISATSDHGLVPDWVLFQTGKGFQPDTEQGEYSSYDAIRVYLWWAMLNPQEPLFEAIRPYMGAAQLAPRGILPERVNIHSGKTNGQAPAGFAAALAPYHYVLYGTHKEIPDSLGANAGYYNHVLSLFGYGWMEHRFRFNKDGSLYIKPERCSTQSGDH